MYLVKAANYLCLLFLIIILSFFFKQILANIGGAIATVYVIHGALCTDGSEESDLLLAQMLNATIFMMGLASLLQSALGIR